MALLETPNARPFSANNWGYPPHNQTSLQYVQQLVRTARLSRGSMVFAPLQQSWQDVSELSYLGDEGQTRTVAQMLDDTYTDAFLVMHKGTVITEQYRNGMGADSHHLLNSVSKSFVGMLVGILAQEGTINPNDSLVSYLPEFTDTAFQNTTLQQALDMTAAVRFGEDYEDRQADFWQEAAVVGWRPELVTAKSSTTLFEYACALTATEQTDGAHFHYRTVLTNVITMAIERATNRSAIQLVQDKIWQRLNPEQDAVVVVDESGFPYFGAGMNACARDLARFGQLLAQNGYYHDQQVVPEQWIEDTLRGNANVRSLFAAGAYTQLIPGGHYRNQTWADTNHDVLFCIGIHGQTIFVNQRSNVVIVKLSSHPLPADVSLFRDTFAAMRAISETL